jgi:RimJ/RimL family protein N-acetyltransferase
MRIIIRHFTAADVPIRSALLRDADFQANLTDYAILTGDEALADRQLRTIAEEQDVKRIFTACRANGQVLGFLWITSIDWRSQSCELSFGLLPRFRGGFGPPAIDAVQAYLYDELNMKVVINQVLEHNVMLHSLADMVQRRRIRCEYDSYTVGEWRTACYWTESEEEFRAECEHAALGRAKRSAQVRAALREAAS